MEMMDQDLESRIKKIRISNKAENTRLSYEKGERYFLAWAKISKGLEITYPVSEDLMIEFVLEHLEGLPEDVDRKMIESGAKAKLGKHKVSSIRIKIRAIAHAHKKRGLKHPCYCETVSDLLRSGQRLSVQHGVIRKQSRAITKDILIRMIRKINTRTLEGLRDRAILEFGFYTGGRRRSEIASAEYHLLSRVRGGYEYLLHRSKTDQIGKGSVKLLRTKHAGALSSWISSADISGGYLFRKISNGVVLPDPLTGAEINIMIKNYIEEIGEDPKKYSAHGIRRGFITQCGRDGIPIFDVMALTGHSDIRQCLVYYEEGQLQANLATKV